VVNSGIREENTLLIYPDRLLSSHLLDRVKQVVNSGIWEKNTAVNLP
jgi:hypothetical protein